MMEMSKPYVRDIQHACHVKKVRKYIAVSFTKSMKIINFKEMLDKVLEEKKGIPFERCELQTL